MLSISLVLLAYIASCSAITTTITGGQTLRTSQDGGTYLLEATQPVDRMNYNRASLSLAGNDNTVLLSGGQYFSPIGVATVVGDRNLIYNEGGSVDAEGNDVTVLAVRGVSVSIPYNVIRATGSASMSIGPGATGTISGATSAQATVSGASARLGITSGLAPTVTMSDRAFLFLQATGSAQVPSGCSAWAGARGAQITALPGALSMTAYRRGTVLLQSGATGAATEGGTMIALSGATAGVLVGGVLTLASGATATRVRPSAEILASRGAAASLELTASITGYENQSFTVPPGATLVSIGQYTPPQKKRQVPPEPATVYQAQVVVPTNQRAKRAQELRKRAICSPTERLCPISSGFECVDTENNLESCGGCILSGDIEARDCSAIPNVGEVSCQAGRCHISSCQKGFSLSADKTTCA